MTHLKNAICRAFLLLLLSLLSLLSGLEKGADASSPFRSDLLLSGVAAAPRLDQLSKLDKTVIINYTVGKNEDLLSICRRYGVDQYSVRSSNDLDPGSVPPGTVIRIPNHRGTVYEVKTPETLETISHGFNRGKLLGAVYQREILSANGFPVPDLKLKDYPFDPGTLLFLPGAWKPTGLPFPFTGGQPIRITSRFGMRKHPILGRTRRHDGFDIAKPYGTPVVASREGLVVSAGWMGGYGNMIEIRHVIKAKKGLRTFYTRYGHLSKILVHRGQHVRLYQMIGRVGSTGLSTGPHLHFEIRDENGVARNPGVFQ
jgi:murein DD-endopeptidase MepM/ murein hydrolase activator NlpD